MFTMVEDHGHNQSHFNSKSNSSRCYNFDNSAVAVASNFMLATAVFILNFMVITAICNKRKRTFRKPSYIYFIALASINILLSFCIFGNGIISLLKLQFTVATWISVAAITSACFNTSINFLVLIAADRLYYMVCYRRYKSIMRKSLVCSLIFLSCIVGFIPIFPLVFWKIGSCEQHCICSKTHALLCSHISCSTVTKGLNKTFQLILFFYFMVMFVTISTLYFVLLFKVRQHVKFLQLHVKQALASVGRRNEFVCKISRIEFMLARTFLMIVITFFACRSPLMVLYVIDYTSEEGFAVNTLVSQISTATTIFHSMLNPITYASQLSILKTYYRSCLNNKQPEDTTRKRIDPSFLIDKKKLII